jgi:myxalamid-type polyketide synthase MxaD
MSEPLAPTDSTPGEPIALIGMGCRFPGAASPAALWRLLAEGREAIGEVPAERWDIHRYFDPDPSARGKIMCRRGGFLSGLDRFDAAFFGISPREAPHLDPRQRLLLEVAWEALEDAGIPPLSLAGSATAVYVAVLTNDYDQLISRDPLRIELYTGTGTANATVANRLSYFLDLRGPSLALDTACSGSLVAIHLAARSLRLGEASLAIAGGVAVNLLPNGDVFFSRAGSLSLDGRCKTFDAAADGMVRSEGAGVVVLKPLARALADGDRIHAVLLGSAVNHDGRSNGIMAPNQKAQEEVLRRAYADAGVAPSQVQYVEAHGTGTRVGDPVEVGALVNVLGAGRSPGAPLVLGSVKTNLGHTESTAGVAGVIKTALALEHGLLPPSLHFRELNPLIPTPPFPLAVQQALGPWPGPEGGERLAGVSGFGFGGTNAHVVLAGPPPTAEVLEDGRSYRVLPLSADRPAALRDLAAAYRDHLVAAPDLSLHDVCYTASVRRSHFEHRLALTAASARELAEQLTAYLAGGEPPPRMASGRSPDGGPPRLVFVFPGQGTYGPTMGRELLAAEPVFRRAIEECDAEIRRHRGWSLLSEIEAGEERSRLGEIDVAQLTIFGFQVALLALWRSWGVEPDAVVGQSLGEIAAAHAAGILSLADAVAIVHHRSRLLRTTAGTGRVAVVGLVPSEIEESLAEYAGLLGLAGYSGPTSSIVSGDALALERYLATLAGRDVFCRLVKNIDVAAHSPQMDPLLPELAASLAGLAPRPPVVPFYSTVTAREVAGEPLDAAYWARNLRQPFRVGDVLDHLVAEGCEVFLEIGPNPDLAGAIKQTLVHHGKDGVALPSLKRDEPDLPTLLGSLGALYSRGYPVDWRRQFPGGGRCLSLPTYPWQREHFWLDQIEGGAPAAGAAKRASSHPLLGEALRAAEPGGGELREIDLDERTLHYLADHRVQSAVLLPGAAFVEMAAAAASDGDAVPTPPILEEVVFERALLLPESGASRVQLALHRAPDGGGSFAIYSRPAGADGTAGGWTRHARGRFRPAAATVESPATDLTAARERCPRPLAREEFYAAMDARDLRYGPRFRAVDEIRQGDGEAVYAVRLPAAVAGETGLYRVHPVLLDACLQGVAATLEARAGDTYLPGGIERVSWSGRPGQEVLCHARLRSAGNGQDGQGGRLLADVGIFTPDGAPLGRIEGLALEPLEVAAPAMTRNPEDCLYQVIWRSQPRREAASAVGAGRWLVLADEGGVGRALAEILTEGGAEVVAMRALPEEDAEDFAGRVRELFAAPGAPWRGAVLLWALDMAEGTGASAADLDRAAALGCDAARRLVQAASTVGVALPLWLVTRGAQPAGEGGAVATPLAAPLWGLGKVLALEHPELWGGAIDLARDGLPAEDAAALAAEIAAPGDDRALALRGGGRWVPRLARLPGAAPGTIRFRADASYLITGGFTGLGLATAQWMVERGARRLLLLGRSPLPPRLAWGDLPADHPAASRVAAVRELERLGAAVHPFAVDVADEAEMRRLFAEHRSAGLPPLRGVVHAAGVLSDQLLLKADDATFAAALRPKLHGAWLLHRLTADLELDFFVLYSSMTAVLGQLGQANYAAGNAFLDALAHYRRARRARGLPALAVNWGPWGEVGLFARLHLAEKAGLAGVRDLSRDLGLAILDRLLAPGAPAQAAAIDADWRSARPQPFLAELQGAGEGTPATSAGSADSGGLVLLEIVLAPPEERRARLEARLRAAAGRVLRADPESLNPGRPLTTLGMDSIMAVELRNSLEAQLHLKVSMVDLFTGSIARLAESLDEQLDQHEEVGRLLAEVERLSLAEVQQALGSEGT